MARFLDGCLDAADWIEQISGYRIAQNFITLEDLDKLAEENWKVKEARGNYFDYPLSETTYITDGADMFEDIQLVRFADGLGGFEYRWCEV